jgi:hypothetical protein
MTTEGTPTPRPKVNLTLCWKCAGSGDLYQGCDFCGGGGDLTDRFIEIFTYLLDHPEDRLVPVEDLKLVAAAIRVCTGAVALMRPTGYNQYEVIL